MFRTRSTYKTLNVIEINAERMRRNVALFQSQHPGHAVIPVLKGNAYGHGLGQVAKILNRNSCSMLAVDGYFEAAKIRRISKKRILVMGYIAPENVNLVDVKRCSFVVQDSAGLKAFGKLGKRVRIHLELNTGMNRLGIETADVTNMLQILRAFPKLELEGVMTHLADADNPTDNNFNKRQLSTFDEGVAKILELGFQPKLIHIAQTAGSTKIHSKYANAIRVGIGTYGINPLATTDPMHQTLDDLQPVLELKSTIIKIVDLEKGDKVSYNGTFTAPKQMKIGVLPIGYYEGLPRALSNIGCVTSGDKLLPIVGRVCMNHAMIDLGKCDAQVGDKVTVISADNHAPNSVARLQQDHDIFSYNLLTSLASTVRREIV